jgi:hypothetical protein
MAMRRPRAFLEPLRALRPIAPLPQMAGFPANPVPLAQHRHRFLAPQAIRDERQLLIHH